ncbi:MAG: ferredoxin family protein [Desulfovibrio sp.]|jgi:NAD-dependent dihydropyrimidine dehydrogenase PreA subunit|nr:ferredoxin family protein [Desulfovibrio sp.]
MPIKVDTEKCTQCGNCETQCPGDLIRMDPETGYPMNAYPDDCWYCAVCEVECQFDALRMVFPTLII